MLSLMLVLQLMTMQSLSADVSSSSNPVLSLESNSVLDLNGHTISCTLPKDQQSVGISVDGKSNIIIRNGKITNCYMGVRGNYAQNVTLDNIDLSENLYIGANMPGGSFNSIINSICRNIRGYLVEAYAICINGIGNNGNIAHNVIEEIYRQTNVSGTGEAVAVLIPANEKNVMIQNNVISNSVKQSGSIGMWFGDGATGIVDGNTIYNYSNPIAAYQPENVTKTNNNISEYVPPAPPSPTVSAAITASGIEITITNGPGGAMDWVALTRSDLPDSAYVDWRYVNGTQVATMGISNATFSIPLPQVPGTYNVRFYANNSLAVKLGTSENIVVVPVNNGGNNNVPNTLPFRICSGTPLVCYSGILTKEQ